MESIQIEVTNICNFNCIYCPRDFLKRSPIYMNMLLFEKIYEMFGMNDNFILNKDGEPFLHPNIKDMITILGPKKNIRIPTNGVYLSNNIVDFLVERPNKIELVITEHILGRGNKQKDYVMNKTRNNFLYLLKKKKSNISIFVLRHHIFDRENDDEEFNNFHKSLQKDYQYPFVVNTDIDRWCDQVQLNNNEKKKSCIYGGRGLITIGVTGNILLCCTDLNEECILGNVINHTKEDIMNKRSLIYDKITSGNWEDLSPCNRCLIK